MKKWLLFIFLVILNIPHGICELDEHLENFHQTSVQPLNRILDEINARGEDNVFDESNADITNNYTNIINYITNYTNDYYLKLDCSNDPLTGDLQLDATFTIGYDAAGYDSIVYGETAGKFAFWDASGDDFDVSGDISVHSGDKIFLDGIDGDFYWTYNSTTEYMEGWVKGELRIEM